MSFHLSMNVEMDLGLDLELDNIVIDSIEFKKFSCGGGGPNQKCLPMNIFLICYLFIKP